MSFAFKRISIFGGILFLVAASGCVQKLRLHPWQTDFDQVGEIRQSDVWDYVDCDAIRPVAASDEKRLAEELLRDQAFVPLDQSTLRSLVGVVEEPVPEGSAYLVRAAGYMFAPRDAAASSIELLTDC